MRTFHLWRATEIVLATLGLVGCQKNVVRTKVPGYPKAYHIRCEMSYTNCLDTAAELCPGGYEIVAGVASGGDPVPGYRTEVTVGCTTYDGSGSERGVASLAPGSLEAPRGEGNEAAAPARAAPRSAPKPPPTGAAGFLFGASATEAKQACESAGEAWQPVSEGLFSCSGTPKGVGMDGQAIVKLCEQKVCAVQLWSTPPDLTTWAPTFTSIQNSLLNKYGQPHERDVDFPMECGGARLQGCLDAGSYHGKVNWSWPSGEKLQLFLGKDDRGQALIRLVYALPQSRPTSTATDGL